MPHLIIADIDECLSAPCQNEGTCKDSVNGFMCTCVKGFEGNKCETSKAMLQTIYFN